MIRTFLAHGGALVRGALAFVLRAEGDIDVVGETGRCEDLADLVVTHRPDVTVLDSDLLAPHGLATWWARHNALPVGSLLILTEARRPRVLQPLLVGHSPRLGFIAKDGPPRRLVAAIRSAARGEQVIDPELVVSAVRAESPLTPREAQVLSVAAEGAPVTEIALQLALSPGTVRNHLSRVIGKAGARTRIEAIRIAQDSGWI